MKFKFLLAVLALASLPSFAQTPVALAPIPQFVSYLQNGEPNAFGCVFTYASGTSTPLTTYTDASGVTANANPVTLTAGGTANIWILAGQAYSFSVFTAGGTNCASGSMVYTVNGIGGTSSYNSTTVTPSGGSATFTVTAQNQLFLLTLNQNVTSLALTAVAVTAPAYVTFQITEAAPGNFTFSWPSNVIGGCTIGPAANQVTTQSFVWNGTNAYALGACATGSGPSISTGAISASGAIASAGTVTGTQIISTVSTGTAPLSVVSTTVVPNLNVSALLGETWAAPGAIGGTTPAAGTFTTLQANTSFTLNGSSPETAVQGTDASLLSSGTMSGSTGATLCKDANGGATTSSCALGGFSAIRFGSNSSVCTTGSGAGSTCSTVVSWNSAFADSSYHAVCWGVGGSGAPFVLGGSSYTTGSVTVTITNGTASQAVASSYSTLDCLGIHP